MRKPKQEWLDYIQKFYCIERTIKDESPEEHLGLRKLQAKPIIDELK